jgi:hypothetical protein
LRPCEIDNVVPINGGQSRWRRSGSPASGSRNPSRKTEGR